MSDFTSIDTEQLTSIAGGVKAEGEVTLPGGSAKAKVDTDSQQNGDPSTYLRCMDLVKKQSGMLESPQSVEARQERQCAPYRAKETR